ncbi:MAG: class I SAM-dependent methyltransferase [Pseudomonadales bacterium]|nr:class I SAM-dependent methyltransferase [Pseudomonadales bacterium]
MRLPIDPESVKGFLHPEEGARLFELAAAAAGFGPCLEVGSYCGRSTVYLGAACRAQGQLLFAVDHHRGSEEHQPGEAYHDADLLDVQSGRMDSLRAFRDTLARAGLEDTVVPLVAPSTLAGRYWGVPLALVFIDGGHSHAAALADYRTWAPRIMPGGILAIHDIFPNPDDGGQAPYEIYQLALASGLFRELEPTRTLGVLERIR